MIARSGSGVRTNRVSRGSLFQHKKQAEADSDQEVGEVHDGGAGIHPHPADVLRHAAHEIAGAVRLIEIGIELLVVSVDLVLLVEFDMAAHDDNGLAHEEHKKTADQSQYEQGYTTDRHFVAEAWFVGIEGADKFLDQDIVIGGVLFIILFLNGRGAGVGGMLRGLVFMRNTVP